MTLRYKFVLPVNLVLGLVLLASLGWEWRRQEAMGLDLLRSRLDEESRFVHAARRAFGASPRFAVFLRGFCHGIDPSASPEHQVALLDRGGEAVVASAAEHARRPMDPAGLAALGEGFWPRVVGGETHLVRVARDGEQLVVVAESTRAVRDRVWSNLRSQAVWFSGAAVLLIGAVNVIMRTAVLRPVRRIGRAVLRLERGELGVEVPSPNGDELGALARQFNAMSRTLALQAEADRREMETARRVQSELLPPPLVRFGWLDVAGRCLQAGPVGGDIYDVQPLPGGRVGLLVADLSGHNVAAALHTAMVRASIWREARDAGSPGEVLSRLNDVLSENLPEEHFATVFFGWFESAPGRLRYANAGHPPALLRRPDGALGELGTTMPLLGILPELEGCDATLDLEPGTRLLVFTDGLTEAQDAAGRLWGTEEIGALFDETAPSDLVGRITERAAAFRGGRPQADDVSVALALYAPAEGFAASNRTGRRSSSGADVVVAPLGSLDHRPDTR